MTLVEILRNLATSVIGSAVADEAKPYVDQAKSAVRDMIPREPQRAITEGATMIDGYPSMSSGLPAETAPYNRKGMGPVDPRTLQEMLKMAADSQQSVAGGTPYEPVQATDVMTPEEEARQAAYNPSQPIDYSDMDARLEQRFRENELNRLGAASNRDNVHDFVRKMTPEVAAQAVTNTAQKLQQEVPDATPEETTAAAVVEEGRKDPSFFDAMGDSISGFFGDEAKMLQLALAFNTLRYQPDQQLAAGIQKRLEQIDTRGKATRTAEVLRARGMNDIADYIEQSGDMKGGMKMAIEAGQWVSGSPDMLMTKFPELEGAFPKGATGTYRYNKMTNKLEGVGQKDQYMGTIPAGYRYNPDTRAMEPIEGTEAFEKWQLAKERKGEVQSGKETMTDTITDAANTIRDTMSGSFLPTTGTAGSVLKYIGETGAAEVRRQVKVLTSQAQVETLNSMRRQSTTGGALGSVTERELKMLSDKAGALDPTADAETFLAAVDDYQRTLYRIVHGYEAGDKIFEQEKAAYTQRSQPAQKPTISPEQAAEELRRRRGQ